jgi:predicted transcriptional regulator
MLAFRLSKIQVTGNIIIDMRKALLIGRSNATITHFMSQTTKIDHFDRAILRLIQRDTRVPQRAIAEAVNLSTAAVQRRIAAMERSGVILRNVAIVDPDQVGLGVTSIVEVNLVDERRRASTRPSNCSATRPKCSNAIMSPAAAASSC